MPLGLRSYSRQSQSRIAVISDMEEMPQHAGQGWQTTAYGTDVAREKLSSTLEVWLLLIKRTFISFIILTHYSGPSVNDNNWFHENHR
jgi:hypothetical protein